MRDRLIELMQERGNKNTDSFPFERVADYLLANGVIVPPCKIGTTIYMIVGKRAKVTRATGTRKYFKFIKTTRLTYYNLERVLKDFGKTVFLSREDAERALRKEQGEHK